MSARARATPASGSRERLVFLLLAGVVVASSCASTPEGPPPKPANEKAVVGRWGSKGCLAIAQPDGTDNYTTLEMVFTPAAWTLDVQLHGDAACTVDVGKVHLEGSWDARGAVAEPAGGTAIDLRVGLRTVTPLVDGFAAAMESAACGKAPYRLGVPQEVTEPGCLGFGYYPKAQCAVEHDVIVVDGDQLRFGRRPPDNNLCTKERRPLSVGDIVLARR